MIVLAVGIVVAPLAAGAQQPSEDSARRVAQLGVAAKALGLTIAPTMLMRADEIIE